MKYFKVALLCFTFFMMLFVLSTKAKAYEKRNYLHITVSIKPLYALVAMVTDGVNTDVLNPVLIVLDNQSPHDLYLTTTNRYTLRYSDVIFIMSRNLENPIYKSMSENNKVIEVMNFPNLRVIPFSNSRLVLNNDKTYLQQGEFIKDYHAWLDPTNAKIILQNVADILSAKDPKNAQAYQQNAQKYSQVIDELDTKIKNTLQQLNASNASFLFYHNGFNYFTTAYGLNNSYSDAAIMTGKKAVSEMTDLDSMSSTNRIISFVKDNHIKCVFLEPQFPDPNLTQSLDHSGIRHYDIDYVGYNLDNNSYLYVAVMLNIVDSLKKCLQSR